MARVGIREVAARAQVSLTAVSFAMNGTGKLSAETRARILQAAEDLDYRPNHAARSLKSGQSRTVAIQISGQDGASVVRSDAISAFQVELLNAASTAALAMGNLLVVVPESAPNALDISGLPIDALILIDPVGPQRLASIVRKEGKPVVSVGRPLEQTRISDVVVDNDHAAVVDTAIEHLLDAGYKQPSFTVGGTGGTQASYSRDLLEAYRASCRRRHQPAIVLNLPDESYDSAKATVTRSFSRRGRNVPDSVITITEETGLAALAAAREVGRSVPDDFGVLSLTTGTATLASHLAWPRLTTIDVHAKEQGRRAVEAAIGLVNGTVRPGEHVSVAHTLLPAGSSARGHRA
ncbi:LacI family DNA-binding transcriptional regulator [Streptomyces sp. NPDC001663]|uniref:LacI family DNA-binding transcriptional regulator n=1 Tax=Streptomyces sp. NPDC001663 TaxID=3364597 RepID=UPI0036C2662C